MNDVLRLERVDFDEFENRDPTRVRILGVFIGDAQLTAHGKAAQWLGAQPKMGVFLGHDGQVYPQFRLVKEKVLVPE